MKILLDCDGIMADFVGATLDVLKRDLGLAFLPSDVGEWDVCKALRLSPDHERHIKAVWRSLGFASSIKPYPEALEGVEALKRLGEIVVVTSPMPKSLTWAGEREEWLAKHFDLTALVSTREKHHIDGDMMIDDMSENLLTSRAKTRLLFRRPWNSRDWPLTVHVANNWKELVEMVDALSFLQYQRVA